MSPLEEGVKERDQIALVSATQASEGRGGALAQGGYPALPQGAEGRRRKQLVTKRNNEIKSKQKWNISKEKQKDATVGTLMAVLPEPEPIGQKEFFQSENADGKPMSQNVMMLSQDQSFALPLLAFLQDECSR